VSDEGASPDEPEPSPTETTTPEKWWKDRAKLARLVALAGVLAVVLTGKSLVLPNLPSEQAVEMRLESPQDVIGLDIRWSAPGSDEDITTTSLRFSPGQAPSLVPAAVRLPDGAYDVAITVERVSRVDSTRRRITLGDASRVTIPLR